MTKDEIQWHTDREKEVFFLYGGFRKKIIYEYFRVETLHLYETVYGVMSSRDEHFQKVLHKQRLWKHKYNRVVTEKRDSHFEDVLFSSPRMITVV